MLAGGLVLVATSTICVNSSPEPSICDLEGLKIRCLETELVDLTFVIGQKHRRLARPLWRESNPFSKGPVAGFFRRWSA